MHQPVRPLQLLVQRGLHRQRHVVREHRRVRKRHAPQLPRLGDVSGHARQLQLYLQRGVRRRRRDVSRAATIAATVAAATVAAAVCAGVALAAAALAAAALAAATLARSAAQLHRLLLG